MEYLEVSKIKTHPELDSFVSLNGKHEIPFYQNLMQSMRVSGYLNPLLVEKCDDGIYLLDGYKRLRVTKELLQLGQTIPNIDKNSVPIEYSDEGLSPLVARFISNIRSHPKYSETAFFLKEMFEKYQIEKEELAKQGFYYSLLYCYDALTKCLPEIQNAIDNEIVPLTSARSIGSLKKEGQYLVYNKLIKKAKTKISNKKIEEYIKTLSDEFFVMEPEKRAELKKRFSQKRRKSSRTYLFNEKKALNDSLDDNLRELSILEKEREKKGTELEKLLDRVDLLFRFEKIKEYMKKHYHKIFEDFITIFRLERNKTLE